MAEAVRSGVNTVASGQVEAARALGLRLSQTLRHVVVPQAMRAVLMAHLSNKRDVVVEQLRSAQLQAQAEA